MQIPGNVQRQGHIHRAEQREEPEPEQHQTEQRPIAPQRGEPRRTRAGSLRRARRPAYVPDALRRSRFPLFVMAFCTAQGLSL